MDDPVQSSPDQEKRQPKGPLIVGVGASAAAMDSIERFFSNLKLDPDQAVVLVLQFRDAVEDGRLQGILRRAMAAMSRRFRTVSRPPAAPFTSALLT
jgi:two-component system, chemotaxis family, CheB/CheR fusion protein